MCERAFEIVIRHFRTQIYYLALCFFWLVLLSGCRLSSEGHFHIDDIFSFHYQHKQFGEAEIVFTCRESVHCPMSPLYPLQPLETEWIENVRELFRHLNGPGRSVAPGETSVFQSGDSSPTLKFLTNSGESHQFLLGRYNALLDAYYVLHPDINSEVHLVPRRLIENLHVAPNKMFQSALLATIRGQLSSLFLLTARGERIAVQESEKGWLIDGKGVDSAFLQSFIRDLYGIRFVSLEKNVDLPETIFLQTILTFQPKDTQVLQTETVTFFLREDSGFWAKRGSSPYVYLLDTLPVSLRNIRGEHFLSSKVRS